MAIIISNKKKGHIARLSGHMCDYTWCSGGSSFKSKSWISLSNLSIRIWQSSAWWWVLVCVYTLWRSSCHLPKYLSSWPKRSLTYIERQPVVLTHSLHPPNTDFATLLNTFFYHQYFYSTLEKLALILSFCIFLFFVCLFHNCIIIYIYSYFPL